MEDRIDRWKSGDIAEPPGVLTVDGWMERGENGNG